MAIKKLGVVGAGTMGAGIAQVGVQVGISVVIVDVDQKFVDRGVKGITGSWQKNAAKGKLTEEQVARYTANLKGSVKMDDLKDCDLVIEAIFENIDVKKKVFKELDGICAPGTVIASNTSALSITEIAAASGRPDRVVGMHFFNPVPVMKLVEVIPGEETSEATVNLAMEACLQLQKTPIKAAEAPGFIVNRLLVPYLNEACIAYGEGVGSAKDIDEAMKLGANMPIGPLALCDMVGLDVLLMVADYFHREFGDSKYRPALALKQKVRAGNLGMKTGKGFYDYTK
ncbi:MAG: 3-hydroxybutyryl-CoA dehydrogenase [Firmicutes bacterium]|nr:3-hydroxybutyryl-CoA dehydrogenase [Bacillota bacterium]